jgi:hypothetical protein
LWSGRAADLSDHNKAYLGKSAFKRHQTVKFVRDRYGGCDESDVTHSMTTFDIHAAMTILSETMPRFEQPLIEAMGAAHQTPFHILIATILSLLSHFSDTHALRVQEPQW